eukprot:gene5117-7128_t
MDADYLKKNILTSLTEGLTAMAVKTPEDQVDFLGKYLLAVVARKRKEANSKAELNDINLQLGEYMAQLSVKAEAEEALLVEKEKKSARFDEFLGSIDSFDTKDQAMDAVTKFIELELKIPAAYIAVKKAVGETETLNYLSASPSQTFIIGKKLQKPPAEEEEAPPRQGLSFDAFKIPEISTEDGGEEEGDNENGDKPPKPVPKALPLFVENTMRERKCKFFGTPKLGSYVALPFSYESAYHENGIVLGPAVEDAPAQYTINKITSSFLIGIDSIGNYRAFKPEEIANVLQIGDALVARFQAIEDNLIGKQMKLLVSPEFTNIPTVIPDMLANITAEEGNVLAVVAGELTVPEGSEPPSELLKPYKESEAIAKTWSRGLSALSPSIQLLQKYVFPLPTQACNLIYAICSLLNYDPDLLKDPCGDISWDQLRTNSIESLLSSISNYESAQPLTLLNKSNSVSSVKSFCEANNLFDSSTYPSNLPNLTVLLSWLQKAIAAREAAIAYFGEVEKVSLEL